MHSPIPSSSLNKPASPLLPAQKTLKKPSHVAQLPQKVLRLALLTSSEPSLEGLSTPDGAGLRQSTLL